MAVATKKRAKLYRLSNIMPKTTAPDESVIDSVRRAKNSDDRRRGFDILMEASLYYSNMDDYRRDRQRNKRYCYGKQWDDIIEVDNKRMTEEEYIKSQGNIPLKNNLIRRLVRNVIGVYRSQSKEPTCVARDRDEQKLGETMSTILQYNMQLNRMNGLLARTMEEFLISGFCVHRKYACWKNDRFDCWTDYVQPNNFFIDSNMRDPRGWDCTMLGEIHDISFGDLCGQFAKSPDDYKRLKEIYRHAADKACVSMYADQFGYPAQKNWNFFVTTDPSRCRVIEVWKKEQRDRYRCYDPQNGSRFKIDLEDYKELVFDENEKRLQQGLEEGIPREEIPLITAEWFTDNYWYYYYISPFGDILEEGETPYEHKSHPYVFMAYPFIDGEIHSFVADVIDQQRYVNRLITLYDWVIRATAKGVLLVPKDCLPEGVSIEDIAERWTEVNGVIVYEPSESGQIPQQVAASSVNIGIGDLLSMQLKFFEDISGVNGALQGKPGYSGTSAALYSQQTQNATTSLLDILEVFSEFIRNGAIKDVKNIQQFYDDITMANIAGKNAAEIKRDPQKIRDVEFDLNVTESTTTPVYRQLSNDILMQLWQAQAISVEQLLENGDFPFADDLLQSIRSNKEAMERGEQMQGVSPELIQKVQQQVHADPRAAQLLQRYMQPQQQAA